jgi:hypothetical protein
MSGIDNRSAGGIEDCSQKNYCKHRTHRGERDDCCVRVRICLPLFVVIDVFIIFQKNSSHILRIWSSHLLRMDLELIRRKLDEENEFFWEGDEVGRAQSKYCKLGSQIELPKEVTHDLNIFCNAFGCGMRFATIAQVWALVLFMSFLILAVAV